MDPRQLPAKDAARYAGVSEKKLAELARDGYIVRRYVGNRPKYERESLDSWIDSLPETLDT